MNKTILVVDDDRDILDAMELLLTDEGYTVQTSEKGETAELLSRDGAKLPNLLILDMLLSGKDGRMITTHLKNQENTKTVPIIMISAHPNAKITVMNSGANAFLAKPFDIDDLLMMVEKYIT